VALLSERLGLFKTVQRHFTSVEEVLPALRELARTGLAISAPRKAELISYLLAEHTHLFDEPLAGGSNAANGGAADAYKAQIVHSATGSELTQLFVVGEGYSNLLWRLQYLDAVGRRFRSVADLRSALASLRGSTPPTDEERELVLAFLASGECTLFQLLDAAAASTAAFPLQLLRAPLEQHRARRRRRGCRRLATRGARRAHLHVLLLLLLLRHRSSSDVSAAHRLRIGLLVLLLLFRLLRHRHFIRGLQVLRLDLIVLVRAAGRCPGGQGRVPTDADANADIGEVALEGRAWGLLHRGTERVVADRSAVREGAAATVSVAGKVTRLRQRGRV